jgi:hypothetical protein
MVNLFIASRVKGVEILRCCSLDDGVLGDGVGLEDEEGASVPDAEPLGDSQKNAVGARVDSPRFLVVEEKVHQSLSIGFDKRIRFNTFDRDAPKLPDFPDPFLNEELGDLLWSHFFQRG